MVSAEVATVTGVSEPTIDAAVYRRRWWILAVLCLSLLIVGIDGTIVNVALPSLVRELGASSSQLQWIVDAYTLVFASFLLVAGSTGDRYRPQTRVARRFVHLRRGIARVGVRRLGRHPDLHPCDPRFRRRVHHAVDAVDPHQRVSAARTRPRDRHLGRHLGCRRRDRSDHGRLSPRAFLVGIDLPRQRPDHHRRDRRDADDRSELTRRTRPRSTSSEPSCRC